MVMGATVKRVGGPYCESLACPEAQHWLSPAMMNNVIMQHEGTNFKVAALGDSSAYFLFCVRVCAKLECP